jgi:dGTPase
MNTNSIENQLNKIVLGERSCSADQHMQQTSLASYAVQHTQGRVHEERNIVTIPDGCRPRTDFQKDRDRIIHSTAFRRLAYKTQVFLNGEGDLFRSRLTHSLEVAQIGRSLAYGLYLNTDLVEAICLAHDMGHPPFGHCGQDILNDCLRNYSDKRFEHNVQSLRIVDKLEKRYADYDGINLCFETREGILKHCSNRLVPELPDNLAYRFIHKKSASLEAQIANVADELAYNHHDIDDGIRAGIITIEQICEDLTYVAVHLEKLTALYGVLPPDLLRKELIRSLLNETILSLMASSHHNIHSAKIVTLDDVRNNAELIKYDEEMLSRQKSLKKFLLDNLYRHPQVMMVREMNAAVITKLFNYFIDHSEKLPDLYKERIGKYSLERVVVDYISGMTDRYAMEF